MKPCLIITHPHNISLQSKVGTNTGAVTAAGGGGGVALANTGVGDTVSTGGCGGEALANTVGADTMSAGGCGGVALATGGGDNMSTVVARFKAAAIILGGSTWSPPGEASFGSATGVATTGVGGCDGTTGVVDSIGVLEDTDIGEVCGFSTLNLDQ